MRPRSRGGIRPSFASIFALSISRGRREGRVTAAPGALAPKKIAQRARDHRYRRIHSGLPCAMVYGLYALSPVNRRLPPSPARSFWLRSDLARHGRAKTTRFRRPHPRRSSTGTSASTASRLTFVTTAIRPSASEAGCTKGGGDLPDGASAYICGRLTRRAVTQDVTLAQVTPVHRALPPTVVPANAGTLTALRSWLRLFAGNAFLRENCSLRLWVPAFAGTTLSYRFGGDSGCAMSLNTGSASHSAECAASAG